MAPRPAMPPTRMPRNISRNWEGHAEIAPETLPLATVIRSLPHRARRIMLLSFRGAFRRFNVSLERRVPYDLYANHFHYTQMRCPVQGKDSRVVGSLEGRSRENHRQHVR